MAGDSSFGGVTFDCEIEPLGDEIDTDVTEQKIPGGSVTYLDISGPLANRRHYLLYFDNPANYTALRALVGTQATLVDIDGSHANALLKRLGRIRRFQGGGQTRATAEFWAP